MSDCDDILISLAPAYTRAILDGKKTVELRCRRMHVQSGTRIWIYSKTPTAQIEATACVREIHEADPEWLWMEFGAATGISRAEFDSYFAGRSLGWAVVLDRVTALVPALGLSGIRSRLAGFHPPQFFKRLSSEELEALSQGAGGRGSPSRFGNVKSSATASDPGNAFRAAAGVPRRGTEASQFRG